jgi:hypothetical protein
VADLKRILATVDEAIPLAFLSGNHDLGNTLHTAAVERYRAHFGDDYYTFAARGLQGIVINTQYFADPGDAVPLAEAHDTWLEQQLGERPPNTLHRFIFGHISPFLFRPDEGDGYFNLAKPTRDRLLSQAQAGGVTAWWSGHYHRNATGRAGTIESVTTSACGATLDSTEADPITIASCGKAHVGPTYSGFRVVRVFEKRYDHSFYTLDRVPDAISLA